MSRARRGIAWLHRFRRLAVRYEWRAGIHQAFLTLGCAIVCHNQLSSTLGYLGPMDFEKKAQMA